MLKLKLKQAACCYDNLPGCRRYGYCLAPARCNNFSLGATPNLIVQQDNHCACACVRVCATEVDKQLATDTGLTCRLMYLPRRSLELMSIKERIDFLWPSPSPATLCLCCTCHTMLQVAGDQRSLLKLGPKLQA